MKNSHHIKLLSLLLFVLCSSCSEKAIEVSSIYVNDQHEAVGIELEGCRLSWKMQSNERNQKQTAYQIVVGTCKAKLDTDDYKVWDSKKVISDQSVLVTYGGMPLQPGTRYYWKVKVWNQDGVESDWSEEGHFITGLIDAEHWSGAKWIGANELPNDRRVVPGIHMPNKEWKHRNTGLHTLPIIRKEFTVQKKMESAFVFISGLGHYEMDLNGKKVGDHFLAPGWTDFDDECYYNVYDITAQVSQGQNAVGVWLGNGFYSIPNKRYRKLITAYGNPKMICKIQLNYTDGTSEVVVSDQTWKTDLSPITFSSIYSGEDFNATMEQEGWNKPGFDDSMWTNVKVVDPTAKKLSIEKDYPVKVMENLEADTLFALTSPQGNYLYDFGQNASGIIEIKVQGNRGDTIKFIPAELLTSEGRANQKATGRGYAFTYILKGGEEEVWRPRFSYYGFRYVEVEGAVPFEFKTGSDKPVVLDVKLLHTRNSSPQVGQFSTSFEHFNKVNELIKWAVKSNMQSVLTDCPHREKLGWLEQTYLMGGGILSNYNVHHLYNKIIDDMMQAQLKDGSIPTIAPDYTVMDFMDNVFRFSPEWGSASIFLPHMLYQWYGDSEPMQRAWPMMTAYLNYMQSRAENSILDYGLGDWYDLGPERPGFVQLTPRSLTATATYFEAVKLMKEMAEVMGKKEDATRYGQMAASIKIAFNAKFYNPDTKIYSTGSQTAIAMPLVLGLVDDENREAVFQTLLNSIENSNEALTAGDIGFHYLVKALQDGDAAELIYKMNAREDVPGYGYQLKKGATALTESWMASELVSNNHLMLGHIMEWFYAGLGGINQTKNSIAFKELMLAPQMVKDINEVNTTYETPYGAVNSHWKRLDEKSYEYDVSVPVNSTAYLILPALLKDQLFESGKAINENSAIQVVLVDNACIKIKIGSGDYKFTVNNY